MCFVRRKSNNAVVPFSIIDLLIIFNGFPSTFSPEIFMNPKTVGNLAILLFSKLT